MVKQIHADLCGDGSHSHQISKNQGMGCASFAHVRVVETEWTPADRPEYLHEHHFEPTVEMCGGRYKEFGMSLREICTPAVPEFLAVILSIYHGLKIIQDEQAKWNIPSSKIHIKIYCDSQNVIDYIHGPPDGHFLQVPWLAILLGMTKAILRQFDQGQLAYELIRMPREDLLLKDCNLDAIKYRKKKYPSFNVDPWIEAELRHAVSLCANIKRMLNEERFHYTKDGIKNTNWEYIPQHNTVAVEHLIINRHTCFHSRANETFMQWYRRQ